MDDQLMNEAMYIARLIGKQDLTGEEAAFLEAWKNKSAANRQVFANSTDPEQIRKGLMELEQYDTRAIAERIFREAGIPVEGVLHEERRTRHLLQLKYWAAAAILALVASSAIYFLAGKKGAAPVLQELADQQQLLPGSNKAVLVLAGGQQIVLDSAGKGTISLQGNVQVKKTDNGILAYEGDAAGQPQQTNTLVTPRGGQYEITLADGTRVKLNSASSIKFPVAFTGDVRTVQLTGEAYFEVAASKARPFIVEANGVAIRVTGTRFNVMAYQEEPAVEATLVEGVVAMEKNGQKVTIRPGQQAVAVTGQTGIVTQAADLDLALAWTRGEFLFKSENITVIMRQIARWYDAEIEYKDDVSGIRFSGGMSRKEDVQHLLELLETEGRLKLVAHGNRIVITRRLK